MGPAIDLCGLNRAAVLVKRQITRQDYTDLNGVAGIVESYVQRGIAAIHPRMTREEPDHCQLLLFLGQPPRWRYRRIFGRVAEGAGRAGHRTAHMARLSG